MKLSSLATALALLVLATESTASPQQPPPSALTELKVTYPYGPQACVEATPDGSRIFVAEGSVIAVLDSTQLSPTQSGLITKIPMDMTQPNCLRYYDSGTTKFLFVAGGSLGLWKMEVCGCLLQASPNTLPCSDSACNPASPDPYLRQFLDSADFMSADGPVHKVCNGLAIVTGNSAAGHPLLCATFGARADCAQGPSELRLYTINGSTVTPYQTINLGSTPALWLPPTTVAYSVASDPIDPNHVYVAAGTGGMLRVGLNAPYNVDQVYEILFYATLPPTPKNLVRDVAVASTTSRTYVYGAMELGQVLELNMYTGAQTLLNTSSGAQTAEEVEPEGSFLFAHRIAALSASGGKALISVGTDNGKIGSLDYGAPYEDNGVWPNICIGSGVDDFDVDVGPGGTVSTGVRIYVRDRQASTFTQIAEELSNGSTLYENRWKSLVLRPTTTSGTYQSIECTMDAGTRVHTLTDAFGTPSFSFEGNYRGDAFVAVDGVASELNSGLIKFGTEAQGAANHFSMLYVQDGPPPSIVPFAASLCNPWPVHEICGKQRFPSPYGGGLFGEAHWAQPPYEWFLTEASHLVIQVSDDNDCIGFASCFFDPCSMMHSRTFLDLTSPNYPGWALVRMRPGTGFPSVPNLDAEWWQIQPITTSNKGTTDYVSTSADPRMLNGMPQFMHALRSATDEGYFIFQTSDLMNAANSTCSGKGEYLENVPYKRLPTHPEVAGTNCTLGPVCASTTFHQAHSPRVEVFQVASATGTRYCAAVAAGKVMATGTGCAWSPQYEDKSMVLFYDVTDLEGAFHKPDPIAPDPTLKRIALGDDAGQAFAVKAKVVNGKNWVFVADLLGRVLVFPGEKSDLYPSSDATDPANAMHPSFVIPVPVNPYDGHPDNCIDLELDDQIDTLYCAFGRGGIGVIDLTPLPSSPVLTNIIDTPGIVSGLTLRSNSQGKTQLIAGDGLHGLRVYSRVGE